MASTVESAIYQLSYDTGNSVEKLGAARQAADQYVQAVERVSVSEEKSTAATRTSVDGMDKLLAKLDPRIKAQQQLMATIDQVNRLQQEGVGSTTQYAQAISLAEQRYQKIIDRANESKSAFAGAQAALEGVNRALGIFGVTLGAVELVEFSKSIFENTAALNAQAEQAGVSTDALQAYRAELRANGITADQTDQIITKLTHSIGDAMAHAGPSRDAFNQLGISLQTLKGGAEATLPALAAGLLAIPDASQRAALEVDLLGRAGQRLESGLKSLNQTTDQVIAKNKEAGQVMDHDLAQRADEADRKISSAWNHLKVQAADPIVFSIEFLAKIPDVANDISQSMARQELAQAGMDPTILDKNNPAPLLKNSPMLAPNPQYAAGHLAPANEQSYPTTELDNFIAKQKLSAQIAGLGPVAQAEWNAKIEAANIKLAAGAGLTNDQLAHFKNADGTERKFVETLGEANDVLGSQVAKQVAGNAAAIERGKQEQKLKEYFSDYLSALEDSVHLATEATTEREKEAEVLKAAQVYQKQRGDAEKDIAKTYAEAQSALGPIQTAEVERAVSARQTAEYEKQIYDALNVSAAALSAERDQRDLIVQIRQDELRIGRQLSDTEKELLATEQKREDQIRYNDTIADMKDQVKLAGMSADAREREEAVLQAMHADHGNLNQDQQNEIRGLVQARQETEKWRGVLDGITSGFQDFFQGVFENGTANFGKLFRAIEAQFASMLAYLAAQALVQPIIVPMVEQFAGQLSSGAAALGVGGSSGALGALSNAGSLANLLGVNVGGLSSSISSGLNWLGSTLGFATTIPGISSDLALNGLTGYNLAGNAIQLPGSTISLGTGPTNVTGSIFGSTSLGGLLGSFGGGSLIGGMLGGNSLVSGGLGALGSIAATSLLGGTGIGTALGSFLGPAGMLVGGLLGGALGDFGAGNKSSTASFTNGGLGFNLVQQGDSGTQSLTTQAAQQIGAVLQGLTDAGINYSNPLSGVNIGNDKSYLYFNDGSKEKLGKADDVPTVVSAALNEILKTVSSTDSNIQQVLNHYMQNGGITADNIDQVVSDLGFAKTLANFDFGTKQLSQVQQTLDSITSQFETAIEKAQQLGLDTSDLAAAEQTAIQGVTDDFNDGITDALNSITDGPLQQWNALVKQQNDQMADAKAASADLDKVEQLQLLQRKQLLMSLDDAQRESLTNLIGLANDLAAKTVDLQASALEAVNAQVTAAQSFAQQQSQLSGQYSSASTSLDQARIGFLVDPNTNRQSPADAYAQSRTQLDQAAAAAQGGDLTALGNLSGLAQTFLQNSLSVNASSSAYGSDFNYVQGVLTQAKAEADAQAAATKTQAQLAQQQVDVLTQIAQELQDPNPDTALLSQMLDKMTALNGALTSNANAIIATLQGDGTVAAVNSLGDLLVGRISNDVGLITDNLDTLKQAADGNALNITQAGPTRDAISSLQGAVADLLSHQSDLNSSQLQAALQAKSVLDQIKSGVSVVNLDSIADPLDNLIGVTNNSASQQTISLSNALDTLRTSLSDGLVTVAEAGPLRGAIQTLQDAVNATLNNSNTLTSSQLQNALQQKALLDQITSDLGAGLDVTNLSSVATPLQQLVQLNAGTVSQIGNLVTAVSTTSSGGDATDTVTAAQAAAAAANALASTSADSYGPKGDSFYSQTYDEWFQWQADSQTYQGVDGKILTKYGDPLSGFAAGTDNAPGGMALVGELGPEIVNLPGGSQVFTNDILRGLLATNDNSAMLAELRAMRLELARLRLANADQGEALTQIAQTMERQRSDTKQALLRAATGK